MDLLRAVDIYCERIDAGFASEPLNAASNAAFFLAGWLLLRRARSWDDRLLAALVALIGAGSLAFHIFATVWAGWLDVVFILAFIYAWLARFLARVAGLGWLGVGVGLGLYIVLSRAITTSFPPGSLNGSYSYLPPLLALAVLAGYAGWKRHPGGRRLVAAAGIFAVSLALRTVDQAWCDAWPYGTHFLWHCLNAVVLYGAATALGVSAAPRAASRAPPR